MFGFAKKDTTYVHFQTDLENPHIYRPKYGTCSNTTTDISMLEVIHHQPLPVQIPEIIIEEGDLPSDDEEQLPPLPPVLSNICVTSSSDSSSNTSPQSNDSLDIVVNQHDLQEPSSSESSNTERDVWYIL